MTRNQKSPQPFFKADPTAKPPSHLACSGNVGISLSFRCSYGPTVPEQLVYWFPPPASGWRKSGGYAEVGIIGKMPRPGLCRVNVPVVLKWVTGRRISGSLIKLYRHNQRLLRNSNSLSSGRKRFRCTFMGVALLSACSFNCILAWRYIWVVSTFS